MKIFKIFILSIFIIILLSNNVFAFSTVFSTAESWIEDGLDNTGQTIDSENLKVQSGKIYNIFLAIATAIAVIVGAILGVKYMTAGIDQKVEVKESLFPYIVSCIVVFGSMGIWKLAVTIMNNVEPSPDASISTLASHSTHDIEIS